MSYSEELEKLYDEERRVKLESLAESYRADETELARRAAEREEAITEKENAADAARFKALRSAAERANASGLSSGAVLQQRRTRESAGERELAELSEERSIAEESAQRESAERERQYRESVAKAMLENDFDRAQALYKAWKEQKSADEKTAKLLAQSGDFSVYAALYGEETAQEMERVWAIKNPALAYRLGKISYEDYVRYKQKL